MSIKEIFCQDKAIGILQRAYAVDKLSHAYIFAGTDGVGKFKTAVELARLLLCKNPVTENNFTDSCGQCDCCKLIEAGAHPDFNLVYKELIQFTEKGKGKKTPVDLPIDVIRQFLIEKISHRPTLSAKKIFIVKEAERLNASSQNALLKSLEEPPEYCHIILLCTHPERLLPTTRSRCQTICFSTIDQERIVEKLKEIGIETNQAKYFARLANGSLGLACQWAELSLADTNLYEIKKKLIDSIVSYKLADSVELAQQLLGESKKIAASWANIDEQTSKTDINRRAHKTLIQIIISALHDAMKLNIIGSENIINFDQKEQIEKLAHRFDAEQAAEKIADACETIRWVDASVNEKLIFEHLLLNLAVSDIMRV